MKLMNQAILLATLAIAAPAALLATTVNNSALEGQSTQADKSKAEQEVKKQLEELREASLRGNTAALEKIYADDAVITFTTGNVGNRTGLLQSYTSGRRKLDTVTIDELKVNVYGDTVVTNSSVRSKGKFRDQAVEEHYSLTTVHVKQQGNWKIVVSNTTTIQPRPAQ
jgi:ketosteroid isomerase-like protein